MGPEYSFKISWEASGVGGGKRVGCRFSILPVGRQLSQLPDDGRDGGNDAIEFGEGISWTDLSFSTSGNDLLISIADGNDQIKIVNGFRDENYRIEQLRFADGSSKVHADIMQVLSTGGAGDDTLVDDSGARVMTGGAGNDQITGSAGPDDISGQDGNDLLVGGASRLPVRRPRRSARARHGTP